MRMSARPARRMESQGLHHGPLAVEPSHLGRRLDHGELAAHVVGRDGMIELLPGAPDDVKVGQRRLDHDDVGPLLDVEPDLAHGLVAVGGVHLVALAVAELRGALRGLPEGPVEGGGVFGRVGHDRGARSPPRRGPPIAMTCPSIIADGPPCPPRPCRGRRRSPRDLEVRRCPRPVRPASRSGRGSCTRTGTHR
jgi:hypothetical protein